MSPYKSHAFLAEERGRLHGAGVLGLIAVSATSNVRQAGLPITWVIPTRDQSAS